MKYIISGIALCPVEVRVEVEAENPGEAIKLAVKKAHANRGGHVVANSEDTTHWEQWSPYVESSSPNNQGLTSRAQPEDCQ